MPDLMSSVTIMSNGPQLACYKYFIYSDEIVMLNLKRADLRDLLPCLWLLQFYGNPNKFYSLTRSADEFTLFIDRKYYMSHLHKIPAITCYPFVYKVLRILELESEIAKTGVVSEISKIFATNDISIMYITTANNDFVLIHIEHLAKAKELLQSNGFDLLDENMVPIGYRPYESSDDDSDAGDFF